jgi:hypothetical protein
VRLPYLPTTKDGGVLRAALDQGGIEPAERVVPKPVEAALDLTRVGAKLQQCGSKAEVPFALIFEGPQPAEHLEHLVGARPHHRPMCVVLQPPEEGNDERDPAERRMSTFPHPVDVLN